MSEKDLYEIEMSPQKYPHSKRNIVIQNFSDDFKKRYPLLYFTSQPCLNMYSSSIVNDKIETLCHAIECKTVRTNIKFSPDIIVDVCEKNNSQFSLFLIFDAIYDYCTQNSYVSLYSMEFWYSYTDEHVYELILRAGQIQHYTCIMRNGIPRIIKIDEAKILKLKEILE